MAKFATKRSCNCADRGPTSSFVDRSSAAVSMLLVDSFRVCKCTHICFLSFSILAKLICASDLLSVNLLMRGAKCSRLDSVHCLSPLLFCVVGSCRRGLGTSYLPKNCVLIRFKDASDDAPSQKEISNVLVRLLLQGTL